jgi:Lar family restriction alleviation protein
LKLEIYGGPKHGGWSGHGEYEPSDGYITSCPFCGSDYVTCANTHTPYYQVECEDCGACGPVRSSQQIGDKWTRRTNRRETERLHRESFRAAIDAWNDLETA